MLIMKKGRRNHREEIRRKAVSLGGEGDLQERGRKGRREEGGSTDEL